MPPWPEGFDRVPDEPWARDEVDEMARGYDAVGSHGWYANLDPTVEAAAAALPEDGILVDYSAGTGLLEDRLLPRLGPGQGALLVDASAKFLRLALAKHGGDERVGFRLLPWLPEERRLRRIDEVVGLPLLRRGADVLVSANAIHLYSGLAATLASWTQALRPRATVLVQSGNIASASPGRWIIDETVERMQPIVQDAVRGEARYAAYRPVLDDRAVMEAHAAQRRRYFLPVRPLDHYLDAFERARLTVESVERRPVPVRVAEWASFLSVYHDGVLGWVGGTERVEGRPPGAAAVRDRQDLIRHGLDALFPSGRFEAEWTYISARRR